MALSDLQVFNEYTYSAMTEVLMQQVELFNAATNGAIVLAASAHEGDFSDTAFYAKIQDLVRRRNVYGSGQLARKQLEHLVDTSVKVAAGTAPVELTPSWWTWIQRNPEEAGSVYGQQMAKDMMADMLNTSIMAYVAASISEAEIRHDATGGTATYSDLLQGASKFGDHSASLNVWVTHSKVMFDIWGTGLTNNERLFTFGTVNVSQDGFGRPIIMTDSPSLIEPASGGEPAVYRSIGLVSGGIYVGQNNDFDQNVETSNGNENIERTIQSEWTYNVGIKGYSWDKTSGGHSPNDMALGSAANWNRYSTDPKSLAGVLVRTQ